MENLDFDTAISKLENILERLENDSELSTEETQALYEEAENLKNHCKSLLDKEKSEIVKIAEENGISLDELDFDEFDLEDDEEKNSTEE